MYEHTADRGGRRSRRTLQNGRSLEFITFTNPDLSRTENNRQRVRSQAMRHVHQQPESSRSRRDEIELDVSLLPGASSGIPEDISPLQSQSQNHQPSQGLLTLIGASRIDPFFQYPISMGPRECELYDHLYDESCIMFRTMRDIGFLNRVRQTAAICQLLAMSSWHAAHLAENNERAEHLGYALVATQKLQNEIEDPAQCSTDDSLAAILAFACSANLLHDSVSLNVHIEGIRLLLNQRGGITAIDSKPLLRIMVYWVDINGAYFQDSAPRFPPPEHLLPRSQRPSESANPQTGLGTSADDNVARFCDEIREVQNYIRYQSSRRNLWQDTMFPGLYLSPILGDLLSLRPELSETRDSSGPVLEAFRLAAILYLGYLRANFGIDVLSAVPLYVSKLRICLSIHSLVNAVPSKLLVWLLCVAYTSSCTTEHKIWFQEKLTESLETQRILSFADLTATLSDVVWDEELLFAQIQLLQSLSAIEPSTEKF